MNTIRAHFQGERGCLRGFRACQTPGWVNWWLLAIVFCIEMLQCESPIKEQGSITRLMSLDHCEKKLGDLQASFSAL